MLNLLNEAHISKFLTRKWSIVINNSKVNYEVGSEIICNTEDLKSNLCDYNDTYILVKGNTSVTGSTVIQIEFKNMHLSLNVSQKLMEIQ